MSPTTAVAERKEPTMTQPLTPAQQQAYTTILNLRKLTAETGTITRRSQNDILQALNSEDLGAVANALAQQ